MPALTPQQIDQVCQLYDDHGWSQGELAEHFGTSQTTVRKALLARGVELRPSSQAQPELRMKQCGSCLHFLPVGLFSWAGGAGRSRRLQSWCKACTAHPKPQPWRADARPLAQAIQTWSLQ